jgi:NAD(P)-dependent dehydrogenase (short-subunit alcohol dehydrogenase family)
MADEPGSSDINVTMMHPGMTRTERIASLVRSRAADQGASDEAVLVQIAAGSSYRRMGGPCTSRHA